MPFRQSKFNFVYVRGDPTSELSLLPLTLVGGKMYAPDLLERPSDTLCLSISWLGTGCHRRPYPLSNWSHIFQTGL